MKIVVKEIVLKLIYYLKFAQKKKRMQGNMI